VLGLAPGATPDEIRAAYRRLARVRHPDVTGGTGDEGMRELNVAYAVLADPVRRYEYDRGLRTEPDEPDNRAEPEPPPVREMVAPSVPARFPWRMVVIGSIVGAVGVVALSAVREPATVPAPDGVLRPGSCVAVEPNTDVYEVSCADDSRLVVRQIVGFDEICPLGTVGHRDRQGSGTACVEPGPGE